MAEPTTHVIPYTMTTGPVALNDTGDTNNLWQRNVGEYLEDFAAAYAVTSSTPAYDHIWIEAEDPSGTITLPAASHTETSRSGQRYISVNDVTANSGNTVSPANAGYVFSCSTKGTYYVWGLVYANTSTDYFWLNVDGTGTATNYQAQIGAAYNQSWTWVLLNSYTLTAGSHQLNYTYGTERSGVDKYFITNDPAFSGPTEYPAEYTYGGSSHSLGYEQHWLKTSAFTLNGTGMALYNDDELAYGQRNLPNGPWPSYLAGPAGTDNDTAPPLSQTPDASGTFTVTGGNYDIWARVCCPNAGENSMYYALNPTGTGTYHNGGSIGTTTYGPWQWQKVTSNVALTAGSTNTITLINREGGTKLDTIAVLLVPTGYTTTTSPVDANPYLVAADAWALEACSYSQWGKGNTAPDLSCAQLLFGISMVYDQCYSQLSSTDTGTFVSTLTAQGTNMYNYANGSSSWHNQWLQNHLWINETGLTTAALAMYGDSGAPSTNTLQTWLNDGLTRLSNTFSYMGTDGASQEGPGYWEYGMEWLLKYMQLSTDLMAASSGTSTMYSVPWIQATSNYRLYLNLPANSLSTGTNGIYNGTTGSDINLADSDRRTWDGPTYILRDLATHCTNSTTAQNAQWLAEQIEDNGLDAVTVLEPSGAIQGSALWLNLLWYTPSITPTAPTAAYMPFNDLGFVVSRQNWSGKESVLTYQCGPFMGKSIETENTTNNPYIDWGAAHAHPVANNFSLFGYGNWLIRNDGYTNTKTTGYDNTLLVNNAGQLGGGSAWFDPSLAGPDETSSPSFTGTYTNSTAWLDYLVGDATAAYTGSGLTKFERHLLYLKPDDVLVVVDDILQSTAQPLELRFFTEATPTSTGSYTYATTNTYANLGFNLLTPTGMTLSTSTLSMPKTGGTPDSHTYISVIPTANTGSWTNAVALSWAPTGSTTLPVTMISDGTSSTALKFRVNNDKVDGLSHTIVLDRGTDENARVVTTIEAESATPASPVVIRLSSGASGGEYIAAENTTANSPDTLTAPSALYTFSVSTTGTYYTWARMYGTDGGSDSFWYALNPSPPGKTYTQEGQTSTHGSWVWVNLGSATLNSGSNTLGFKYREVNAQIDQFIVTSDPTFTPTGEY